MSWSGCFDQGIGLQSPPEAPSKPNYSESDEPMSLCSFVGCFSVGILFWVNFAASCDFSQLSHEPCGWTVSLHMLPVALNPVLDTTVIISHFQQRFYFQMNSLTYLVGAETQGREMGTTATSH